MVQTKYKGITYREDKKMFECNKRWEGRNYRHFESLRYFNDYDEALEAARIGFNKVLIEAGIPIIPKSETNTRPLVKTQYKGINFRRDKQMFQCIKTMQGIQVRHFEPIEGVTYDEALEAARKAFNMKLLDANMPTIPKTEPKNNSPMALHKRKGKSSPMFVVNKEDSDETDEEYLESSTEDFSDFDESFEEFTQRYGEKLQKIRKQKLKELIVREKDREIVRRRRLRRQKQQLKMRMRTEFMNRLSREARHRAWQELEHERRR